MKVDSSILPGSWEIVPLSEVCEILDSRRVPVNNRERAQRIEGKSVNSLYPYYGATGQVGLIDDYIFEGEYVLLGEDGAPFLDPYKDKAYLVKGKFWVNNHAHILKSEVSNKYLCYYLNQVAYSEHVTGTTRLKLNQAALKQIPVHCAPAEEQHRIVAKIEALFSELDKGVEALKTAREQLKVYRQAVLKHAFEGRLTAQWREDNKGKLESPDQLLARIQQEREARYQQQLEEWKAAVKAWEKNGKGGKKPRKPKEIEKLPSHEVSGFPALPSGWCYAPLSWLLSVEKKPMTTGPFGTMLKKNEHKESGVPVLGIENIGQGKYVSGNKIFVSEEKAVELSAFQVHRGDVVISRSGTVGEICEIPSGLGTALMSTNLLKVSLNSNVILSPFFVQMFQGGGVRGQVKELCKGSSREFLNQAILNSIAFPVCGVSEQKEVIRLIEEKFSSLDKFSEEIDENLIRLQTLRQSILKKAFSGQLVLQHPNDEPASTLLERISAKKGAQAQRKGVKTVVKKNVAKKKAS